MRGSLTVFLAMVMVLFLAFTGACLEYARAQAVSYQTEEAAVSSARSIFAGYSAALFSEYRMLARLVPQGDFSALSEETKRYASAYGEGSGGISFEVTETSWGDVVFVTDQKGAVFTAMAAAALADEAVEIVTDTWLERLGLSGDSEQTKILQQNAGKEELTADSLLDGYDEWKDSLEEAQTEAQAEADGDDGTDESGEASGEGVTDTRSEEEKKKGESFLDLLAAVKKAVQHGVLTLVVPSGKTISEAEIPTDSLPSALSAETKSRSVGSGYSVTGGSLLLREYLVRNLDCFTSGTGKSPAYELEYVLAGKSTDEANLKAVVHRLLWIRTGMNMLYLLKSASKQAVVQEAAMLAVGWLGIPLLTEGMAVLLTTVWAFSEALADVRALLGGNKVVLMKTDSTWKLSLDGLVSCWSEGTVASGSGSGDSGGLSYEDYLRICLYLTSEENCCYRGMDVIQWNIQKKEPSFLMVNCMVSGTMDLTVKTSPLFSPLYGSLAGMGDMEYTKTGSYTYL